MMHFTLSLVAGAMLARGQKRPLLFALACGALGLLPDVDHYLTSPSIADSWMHSGYFLVVAPLMIFVAAFVYDHAKPERNSRTQALALAVLAILAGHLALDIAAGNALPIAYPVESGTFETSNAIVLYAGIQPFLVISDVPLACWAGFCLVAFAFVEWTFAAENPSEEAAKPVPTYVDRLLLRVTRPRPV